MYSRTVRVLRALFRLEGWCAQGTPAPAPAVYVVHHQNMAGPIRAVGISGRLRPSAMQMRALRSITAIPSQSGSACRGRLPLCAQSLSPAR